MSTRKKKLSAGDTVRIPIGLLLMVISVGMIVRSIGTFALEPVAMIVAVLGFGVGVLFIGIGFTMVFAPFVGRKRSRKR